MAMGNRILFLEAIKSKAFTLKEIQETFNVSPVTARNWSRLPQVEQVDGSYPLHFRAKGLEWKAEPSPVVEPPKIPKNYIELPVAPAERIQEELDKIFDPANRENIVLNFNEAIKAVESPEDLDKLIIRLKSAIVIALYYKSQL